MNQKQNIIDFMQDFTAETTPGSALKTPDYREHLRENCVVAVTFLPGSDYKDTVATAKRLREEGFEPAPHIAARSIKSEQHLKNFLQELKDEAGVDHVVALAGAVNNALGPYESSMDLMRSGLFDAYGMKKIGVAGHPEGNPDISETLLREALTFKNDFQKSSDAYLYIATQFVFEAAPIIAWDKKIQSEGNALPIHIGVPGIASLKALVGHAKACGIGASMKFLTRQARNITKLMSVQAPDKLIIDLAEYKATDPSCGISKVHMYPLGGLRRSAIYSYMLADGQFDLNDKGDKIKFYNSYE